MPDAKPYDDNPGMGLDILDAETAMGVPVETRIGDALERTFAEFPPQFEIDYWRETVRLCVKVPLPDEPDGEWPAWYIGLEDLIRGTLEQDRENMGNPNLVASAVVLADELRRMADLIESALPKAE